MIYGLILSLVCNVIFLVWILRLRRPGKAAKPELTKDATELLSDLMGGGSVIVTQVINPSDIFLYSPKDSQ
jgi:hypothetical protein